MIPIDEAEILLDGIAEDLPPQFFERLNGGISLLPECKRSRDPDAGELYTLGEYHVDTMGRYIVIYYGSFEKVYGHISAEKLREKLRDTLLHEFTHHWESLSGERDLEIKDEMRMEWYREQYRKRFKLKRGL
jgi:hypothetical protein